MKNIYILFLSIIISGCTGNPKINNIKYQDKYSVKQYLDDLEDFQQSLKSDIIHQKTILLDSIKKQVNIDFSRVGLYTQQHISTSKDMCTMSLYQDTTKNNKIWWNIIETIDLKKLNPRTIHVGKWPFPSADDFGAEGFIDIKTYNKQKILPYQIEHGQAYLERVKNSKKTVKKYLSNAFFNTNSEKSAYIMSESFEKLIKICQTRSKK